MRRVQVVLYLFLLVSLGICQQKSQGKFNGESPVSGIEDEQADDLSDLTDPDEGETGDGEDKDGAYDSDGDDGRDDGASGRPKEGGFMKNETDNWKPSPAVGNSTSTPPVNSTIQPIPATTFKTKRCKGWWGSCLVPQIRSTRRFSKGRRFLQRRPQLRSRIMRRRRRRSFPVRRRRRRVSPIRRRRRRSLLMRRRRQRVSPMRRRRRRLFPMRRRRRRPSLVRRRRRRPSLMRRRRRKVFPTRRRRSG